MTDLNRGLNEVPGLIAERKRYEAWLAALDQRRESTPGHVFERVQADYKTRLQRVAEELASHRHAIEDERKNVVSRLSLLEAEEQMRRDERAELELRSHVGELEGEEALSAFGAVDEAIAGLVNEKGGLQTRISELESLLEPATPTVQSQPVGAEPGEVVLPEGHAASSDPADASPRAGTDSVAPPVDAHVRDAATTRSPVTTAAVPEHHVGANEGGAHHASAPAAPAVQAHEPESNTPRPSRSSTEIVIPPTAEHATVAAAAEKAPPPRVSSGTTAAAASSDPNQSFRASDGLRTPSGSFDELKFLDTVIGKEQPKPRGPRASEISPLKGVEGNAREALGVPPLAANVPGNTPIVLRPSVAIDQSKTLKCSECGASNYPTEWYCERCGAELAAL